MAAFGNDWLAGGFQADVALEALESLFFFFLAHFVHADS